jgi:proton-coupled amino acid transporter
MADDDDVLNIELRQRNIQKFSSSMVLDTEKIDGSAHLKTYTAGEDGSRLAEMAKEFGLANQRQPRKQVRDPSKTKKPGLPRRLIKKLLDPSFEDISMRAVYSSHDHLPGDERGSERILLDRMPTWMDMPTWMEEEERREEAEEEIDELHGAAGGDLVSAVLGIIKGMVGPAILYLPHGFASAGYLMAIPIMTAATCMFLHSSKCLLDSWKLESTKPLAAEHATLLEDGSKRKRKRTMLSYPELAFRALGPTGEMIVKLGIALMQSGVCLTYLIFVPQNLNVCARILFGVEIPTSYFLILMLIIQIPLSWIRDIRKLTVTNLLANVLILYGLVTCLFFAIGTAIQSEPGRGPLEAVWYKLTHLEPVARGWFLFIGTSVSF